MADQHKGRALVLEPNPRGFYIQDGGPSLQPDFSSEKHLLKLLMGSSLEI